MGRRVPLVLGGEAVEERRVLREPRQKLLGEHDIRPCGPAPQRGVVLLLEYRRALGGTERVLGDHRPPGVQDQQVGAPRDQQPHQLAGVHRRHRVAAAAEADQAIPAHLPTQRERAHEPGLGQRGEMGRLRREAVERALLRGTVHPGIQVVLLERRQLLQEVREGRKAPTLEELLLQVEERPFHLALGLCPVRLAGPRLHPVVAAQLQELRVPAEVGQVGVEHERLGVIDQQLLGGAAEVPQAQLDRLEDRHLRLVQAGRVVLAPRVPQRQPVHDHLDPLAAQLGGVRRPVELPLLPGRGLEAHRGLGRRHHRPQTPQVGVQRARRARVAQLPQLAENAGADQVVAEV